MEFEFEVDMDKAVFIDEIVKNNDIFKFYGDEDRNGKRVYVVLLRDNVQYTAEVDVDVENTLHDFIYSFSNRDEIFKTIFTIMEYSIKNSDYSFEELDCGKHFELISDIIINDMTLHNVCILTFFKNG